MRLVNCFITFLLLLLSTSFLFAQTLVDGAIVSGESTGTQNAGNDYIHLYQKHLSSLKNGRCAMYPSCSNYGLMVYSDKNFFEATTLLCDRIVRCSHDKKFYETTYEYGYKSLIDQPYYKNATSTTRTTYPKAEILKSAEDTALLFVNHLINEEEYSSALLEIERLHFHRKELSTTLYLKKLQCYRGLGLHEKALYNYAVNYPQSAKKDADINIEIATINYILGNYQTTIDCTNAIKNATNEQIVKSKSIQAVAHAKLHNYNESKNIFTELSKKYPDDTSIQKSIKSIDLLINNKEKSPLTAKLLSVIPGAGYLYTGHKGSAATSLIINSLLAYATYTSIKKENYGVAGIMGFFSLSFYIGNINGAGRSAKRYNEKKTNHAISKIEIYNNIINH